MSDLIKVQIMQVGVPNRNGVVFTEESLQDSIKNSGRTLIGLNEMPSDGRVSISEASHVGSNLRIEDNKVFADIIILDNPRGKLLKDIFNYVDFTPIGYGKVDENGVVSDYELVGISIIQKG